MEASISQYPKAVTITRRQILIIHNTVCRLFFFSLTGAAFWLCPPSDAWAWQPLAEVHDSASNLKNSTGSELEPVLLLDSPQFSQRQLATAEIIRRGAASIPVLVKRYFEGSPETAYRIRKALEGIAAEGEEETFLKSAAILLTLYSNGNDQIAQQIQSLQIRWRKNRTEMAIAALKRSGAEVVRQIGYDARFGGQEIVLKSHLLGPVANDTFTIEKRTVAQQQRAVDAILAGDADHNRAIILNVMPEQARLSGAALVGNQSVPHLAGTTIKFPPNWPANNADIDLLNELQKIDDRLFVEITGGKFTKIQWQALAAANNVASLLVTAVDADSALPTEIPGTIQMLTLQGFEIDVEFTRTLDQCQQLQQLQLSNCRFDQRVARRIDVMQNIKSLVCQFENFLLDDSLINAMAELSDLRSLYLTAVDFEEGALASLRRLSKLTLLYVSNMPATSDFFQNVKAIPRLNNINFKGCKLDIAAYKRLALLQRVRMNFQAQAFLGIQGRGAAEPGQLGGAALKMSAEVAMVIPNSAADAGGVATGDLIHKIDGQKVEGFEDVRLHITQYAAGDEVAIEVLRNGKPVALTVKLQDYETAPKF